jgi:hypothetical protein
MPGTLQARPALPRRTPASCLLTPFSCFINSAVFDAVSADLDTHSAGRPSISAVLASNSAESQLTAMQSSRPNSAEDASITAVFVANSAASHLISSASLPPCRTRQPRLTHTKQVTTPGPPPRGYPFRPPALADHSSLFSIHGFTVHCPLPTVHCIVVFLCYSGLAMP